MLQLETEEEIQCTADDLLVFIDDTGHELFLGNQEYYGLGGCVVLGAHYGRLKTLYGKCNPLIPQRQQNFLKVLIYDL